MKITDVRTILLTGPCTNDPFLREARKVRSAAFIEIHTDTGFIGLGVMGKPMAKNLMKAGHALVVHNRSRPAVDELAAEGASPATSPADVARRSGVVITMP